MTEASSSFGMHDGIALSASTRCNWIRSCEVLDAWAEATRTDQHFIGAATAACAVSCHFEALTRLTSTRLPSRPVLDLGDSANCRRDEAIGTAILENEKEKAKAATSWAVASELAPWSGVCVCVHVPVRVCVCARVGVVAVSTTETSPLHPDPETATAMGNRDDSIGVCSSCIAESSERIPR